MFLLDLSHGQGMLGRQVDIVSHDNAPAPVSLVELTKTEEVEPRPLGLL